MDRIGINPLAAVRLLLVSGLFVVIWLIFGAGSAQAAESSPADGTSGHSQPAATGGGLLPSLSEPVTSLVTPVQPPAVSAPVSKAPAATAPLADDVSSALAPVAGLAKQVTEAVPALPGALTAPIASPVTELVTDAIEPVSGPVNSLTGSALSLVPPLEQPLTGVTAPPVASLPAAAGAVETPVSGTAEGALTPRHPVADGPVAAPAAPVPASFPVSTARTGQGQVRSMAAQGGPLQNPPPAPGGVDPFVMPAPGPVSRAGGQGQSGAGNPGPAGQVAVADLGNHFILPPTRGGLGSVFSFVLPGAPAQETGFSPD